MKHLYEQSFAREFILDNIELFIKWIKENQEDRIESLVRMGVYGDVMKRIQELDLGLYKETRKKIKEMVTVKIRDEPVFHENHDDPIAIENIIWKK